MSTLPNPFEPADLSAGPSRFVLAFMDAIEPPPVFLSAPSPQYMQAREIMPVLQVLGRYI